MNISAEIYIHIFNASDFFLNGTEVNAFHLFSIVSVICILMSFPLNTYVIWLIITGNGNGLASEFFNLNLSACEILLCAETSLVLLITVLEIPWIVLAFLNGLFMTGRPLFQCLICVERYLAVVHPVIFLKFKPLRYRLMCSAVVWMVAVVFGGLNAMMISLDSSVHYIFLFVLFFVLFSIQLFFCLAVLRVLKQSGPGERGREEENHIKTRAFHLILSFTVTTVILYATFIILLLLSISVLIICFAQICFTFTGLVQPVLFLYRGKPNFIIILLFTIFLLYSALMVYLLAVTNSLK